MTQEPPHEPKTAQPRNRFGRALCTSKPAQLAELAGVFLLPLTLLAAVKPLIGAAAASLAIILMVVLMWLGLRLRGQTWGHFGLSFRIPNRRNAFKTVLLSVPAFLLAAALWIAANALFTRFGPTQTEPDMSGYNSMQGNLPRLIVMIVILWFTAAFAEEVIYRGFLLNRIAELGSRKIWAWILALTLSSLAFALAHYQWGPAGMIQAGAMGLALGAAYLAVGRNLWVTILAHGYMDTILMVQMYLRPTTES